MIAKKLLTTIAFAFVLLFSGCAEDDFVGVDGLCPLVVSTVPDDEDFDVPLNQVITATFNEIMNTATITEASFTVSANGALIDGAVSYDGLTASFDPTFALEPDTEYTGTITTMAADPRGNFLQENYVWSFTTLPEYLVVVSSDPIIGGVTTGGGLFLKGTPVTVTAVANTGYTFTNWTINGVFASDLPTYTLPPLMDNVSLVANYTAVIPQFTITLNSDTNQGTTNGAGTYPSGTTRTVEAIAKSGYTFNNWTENGVIVPLAGASYQFVLTQNRNLTANFVAIIQPPVNAGLCNPNAVDLGMARNYAILAKTAITSTGVTSITGNVGISPNVASAIEGFSLIRSVDGTFSTSNLVTGRVYASDYTTPTPSNVGTAVGDMLTAFTTANGIAPTETEYKSGNLNNEILVSGVYKFGTDLNLTNTITLDGGGTNCAVFVFQIAGSLIVNSNTKIILINGAKADNIYWVVAGAGATLNTDVEFSGTILSEKLISLAQRTTVNGRLLAQTAVTLIGNTVVMPSN